ncbi:hypothetical protein DPX16_21168 [Anabarilius grahami]|uniref:Uncharacterized protein n=1 Tax=Anabarilius grahami TaxID=495550 RepID=A0A3N0Z378_ANAGA|nr:hypothetical protein DPX16_21168 [Anabarilius grahami]
MAVRESGRAGLRSAVIFESRRHRSSELQGWRWWGRGGPDRERERVGGKAGTLIVFWALERKRVCVQVKLGVGVCLRPLNCLLAFSHSSRQIGMRKDGGILSLNHLHPLKLHFRKDDLHHGPMCT